MTDRLDRFVSAQADSYDQALAELRRGRKASHWMWWVFPQVAGLGRSDTARFYAIADAAEARAYLAHPALGRRLIEASDAVIAAPGSAEAIMGAIDAVKLKSSMTLFAHVADDPAPFRAVLERFYRGEEDAATVDILRNTPSSP
ncbi:uncharacterized protein (DUF1810 family) [Sphingomonas jinjuensis]|uniref:Uncharacterized protein (DUF1810 family) n=1 Tax=Sphingomonas jinjuensis TaxID=535907 RepID=A0A840F769_9SPHN|nr:DUF1810 domain-containing protein [Sphingomonas jinjuensis]MBB4152166.1 uncharacterized protein (DUF1810 family) [Sphingomonas jinjuensis]